MVSIFCQQIVYELTRDRSFLGQIFITGGCFLCVSWLSIASRRKQSDQENAGDDANGESSKKKRGIDFAGVTVFAIMLTSLLLAISMLDGSTALAPTSYAICLLAVFLVAAIALFFVERNYARAPFIPLELIKGTLGVQMLIQCVLLFAQLSVSLCILVLLTFELTIGRLSLILQHISCERRMPQIWSLHSTFCQLQSAMQQALFLQEALSRGNTAAF